MSHTKTPWCVEEKRHIKRDLGFTTGEHIANATGGSTSGPYFVENNDEVEANARRIVACVNACDGISTESLESLADTKILARSHEGCLSVIQQRDALLSMLKEVLPHIVGMGLREQAQELIDSIEK